MKSTIDNAEWISNTFVQGGGETDWKDYQTEVRSTPVSATLETPLSASFRTYTTPGRVVVHKADNTGPYIETPAFHVDPLRNPMFALKDLPNSAVVVASFVQACLCFSEDGTKMYAGYGTVVSTYTLSTPWDATTAGAPVTFNTSATISEIVKMQLSPDGTRLYILDNSTVIRQYTLSTPWLISSLGAVVANYSVSACYGFSISRDGTRIIYIYAAVTSSGLYSGAISTPWMINTASAGGITIGSALNGYISYPYSLMVSPDGCHVFVNNNDSTLHQFRMSYDHGDPDYTAITKSVTAIGTRGTITPNGYIYSLYNNDLYRASAPTSYVGHVMTVSSSSTTTLVLAQATSPVDTCISTDGTKFYILNSSNRTIAQFALSTPFDITTISYSSKTYTASTQTATQTFEISPTGTVMFIFDSSNRYIYKYTLSTAWDISTASYASENYNCSNIDGSPQSFCVSPNGLTIYIIGVAGSAIYSKPLTVAWSFSGGFGSTSSWNYSGFGGNTPQRLQASPDGTFLIVSVGGSSIYRLDLSTPYVVSSQVAHRGRFYHAQTSVRFDSTFTRAYFLDNNDGKVTQRSCESFLLSSSVYSYSPLSITVAPSAVYKAPTPKMYALLTATESVLNVVTSALPVVSSTTTTAVLAIDNNVDVAYRVNDVITLDTATYWAMAAATYIGFKTMAASMTSVTFSADGSKCYVFVYPSNNVFEYPLSTPWLLSSAGAYNSLFSVGSQTGAGISITFSYDGSKMYLGSTSGNNIWQYTLSTPWLLSSIAYANKVFTGSSGSPSAIAFKKDGLTFFMVTNGSSNIHQYSLSVPWDITTSAYVKTQSPGGTDIRCIAVSENGYYLLASDATAGTLKLYSMSTPWDLSLTFVTGQSRSFASIQAVGIKGDGSKFYMSIWGDSALYQYNMAATFPLYVNTTVSSISVAAGKTTLTYPTQASIASTVSVTGRSTVQTDTSYEIISGDLVARSDRIALPNGKRYAKFKVTAPAGETVTNVKLNLWKT